MKYYFYQAKELRNMVYVITGGPGFGKSVLIEELRKIGYPVGNEIARQIIEDQLKINGDLLPWRNPFEFEMEVTKHRVEFLKSMENRAIAFSDRGLPDQAAFSLYKGKTISQQLSIALAQNRYAKRVFLTPPWLQIYRKDTVRTETFEESVQIHRYIEKVYIDLGYELLELPSVPVEKRIEFILESLIN